MILLSSCLLLFISSCICPFTYSRSYLCPWQAFNIAKDFHTRKGLFSLKNSFPYSCSIWSAKSKKINIFSMRAYHYILFNLNCHYCTFLTANYILSNKYYTLPNINYILLNKHCVSPSANYT